MGPCYVVFYGKKPVIYMSWQKASEHVLGFKNAIHKKYNNYDMHIEISKAMLEQQLPPLNWSQLIVVKASPLGW
jgi:viroplasmin and RNaseH domain-containing protein